MTAKAKKQANPIGIDLSDERLRAVQVETLEDVPRLVDMVESRQPVKSDDELRAAIARLLKEHKFTGRRIVTAVPSAALSTNHVRLPMMPPGALDAAICQEISNRLTYAVEDAVVRHLEIASGSGREGHADHIVFSVPRAVVEQHLRMAERLGLTLVGVSALPLAVAHAFSYLGQRREEANFTFLLVHLESRATHLVIVHDGQMRFARTLGHGVHDLLEAVAHATGRDAASLRDDQEFQMRQREDHVLLDSRATAAPGAPRHASPIPYEQAGQMLQNYVDEIVSCLCYFSSTVSSHGVDKVIFVGPQANDYALCQILANRLGLPAQIGDPLAGVQVPASEDRAAPAARRPKPEMSVAVGLTLFGVMAN